MIKNWIKIYLQQVRQNVFHSVLNVLGLAIGVAGLIFAILYWNDEHAYDAWNPHKDNTLFVVTDLGEGRVWGSTASPVGKAIETEIPEITSYCYVNTWYNDDILEADGTKVHCTKIADAQPNFFSFFPHPFVKGNPATALRPNTITLSEATAVKLFGSTDSAMGKSLKYGGNNFTVTGVYHIQGKSAFMPDAVTSIIEAKLKETEHQWGYFTFGMYVRVKNPDDAALVAKKIENLYYKNTTLLFAKNAGITPEDYVKRFGTTKISVVSVADLRLNTITQDVPEQSGNYKFLIIMVGLSVLIMVMSVANYINLATANAIKRAKEVGVRKVLGASTQNIIAQFIAETVFTLFISVLLALVIVELSLPYYNAFLNKSLELNSAAFYVQLIVIFVAVVITAGIFPALYVSKFNTISVLKGNFIRGKKGTWLRNAMLVGQFAIASFFTIGAYVVYSQVNYMLSKDTGFKADQIVQIYYRNPYDFKQEGFREKLEQKYSHVKEKLLQIKGVQTVGVSTMSIGGGNSFETAYNYNQIMMPLQNMAVDYGVLNMLNVKMKTGRLFSEKLASDSVNTVILNETAAAMMKEKNPLGKSIRWDQGKYLKVIGVVKDFHVDGPQRKIAPMAFTYYKTLPGMLQNAHSIYIKVAPEDMQEALASIEALWKEEVDPDFDFSYDFVDKNYARTFKQYVLQRNLFTLLNSVVMIIALFGLFALASFSIQRRMKEIAIRKTLGASTGTLLREISWHYVLYCTIGFLLSVFPAWLLLQQWLQDFAYRISVSFIPFITGFVALLILTLFVVLGRAYNATRVPVVKYLKYE